VSSNDGDVSGGVEKLRYKQPWKLYHDICLDQAFNQIYNRDRMRATWDASVSHCYVPHSTLLPVSHIQNTTLRVEVIINNYFFL
jgi:hypothetical protein